LKKLVFLTILMIFCGCSLLSNNEIGLAKKFPSGYSFAPKIGKRTPALTNIIQPTVLATEDINLLNIGINFVHRGPGEIIVPILLYHHILKGKPSNPYSVSMESFYEQLSYLKNDGYRSISILQLIQAISMGANLPEKSIIMTFDDGNENVYLNAFPLMKEFGFIGVVYIIANRIDAEGFLTRKQIIELLSSGWEIGCHGMKHIDLVQNPEASQAEIGASKKIIEGMLDIKVASFAYPYGKATKITIDWVKQIKYLVGMGLGISNQQNIENLFYLSRRQVDGSMDLSNFKELLSIN
jgi:peptidoglycan/xylan/chitin deacetylase (PgdA/CDA1 family)